jgi:quinohemoprotein ethanol dehydrogenase
MQAPKNGFFYVLDRATGELLSAEPYVQISWAKGVDKATGRPIENPGVRYEKGLVLLKPGPLGGHNWQPMSFNPQTGLVYIPAQDFVSAYLPDPNFEYRPGTWNLGSDMRILKTPQTSLPPGHLLAWDPILQKERWRVQYRSMWNGGTLTTAGNLVFQGTADGRFVAYSADKGTKLWEYHVGIGVMGSPMTYEIGGVQYVAVMAGWGGAFALLGGNALEDRNVTNVGRLIVFALGGKGSLIPIPKKPTAPLTAIESNAAKTTVEAGANLFAQWCAVCHGAAAAGGGVLPDLRQSKKDVYDSYREIVLDGAYSGRGMPSFKRWLTPDDVDAIRAYLVSRRAELMKTAK